MSVWSLSSVSAVVQCCQRYDEESHTNKLAIRTQDERSDDHRERVDSGGAGDLPVRPLRRRVRLLFGMQTFERHFARQQHFRFAEAQL